MRPVGAMRTITVQAGETLGSIAARELGDPDAWPLIYAENVNTIAKDYRNRALRREWPAVTHPWHWIFPGQVLRIPR